MQQRKHLGWLALVAASLFVWSGTAGTAREPAAGDEQHGRNPHMQHCARSCADCMRACESCARHCAELIAGGQKEHMHTLGTCADCGDICATAAKLTAREGPLAVTLCAACAKACAACGAACGKSPDDKQMQDCAKVCRECEKVCREMIGETGQGA